MNSNRKVQQMRKIKGLLFDLDGVIVDTAKYHYLAWKELADELGIKFTLEDNERLKGVSRIDSFQIILEIGNRMMSEEKIELCCTKKNDIYVNYIKNLQKEEILPGAEQFLRDAREKQYKIGLGSASKNTPIILERLGIMDLFDIIIDGTKTSKAKPDPEVFLLGAIGLGLKPEECVVFEDAVAGIEAAHNAGMLAVGIGSSGALPKADMVMDNFAKANVDVVLRQLPVED